MTSEMFLVYILISFTAFLIVYYLHVRTLQEKRISGELDLRTYKSAKNRGTKILGLVMLMAAVTGLLVKETRRYLTFPVQIEIRINLK